MRKIAAIVVGVFLVLAALLAWERWDEHENRGYRWGYWGDYNSLAAALAKLPDVSLTDRWCNADTFVVEEFGFQLVAEGKPIRLMFDEKDPVRRLRGDSLARALADRIKKARANQGVEINAGWPPASAGKSTAVEHRLPGVSHA